MLRRCLVPLVLLFAFSTALADELPVPYLWSSLFDIPKTTGPESLFALPFAGLGDTETLAISDLFLAIRRDLAEAGPEPSVVDVMHTGADGRIKTEQLRLSSGIGPQDESFGSILQETIRGLSVFDKRNRQ
jgi:hypothetical protein